MPNHIKNQISFEGKKNDIKKAIKGLSKINIDIGLTNKDFNKTRFNPRFKIKVLPIDFNKIKKMPKSLNITSGSMGEYGEYILNKTGGISFLGEKEILKRWREMSDKDRKECLKLGSKHVSNLRKYGHQTWYSWAISNWGTKWNAYSQDKKNNIITFETAWSGIPNLIKTYSIKHPYVTFKYIFADEDSGSNTGKMEIKNGEIIKDQSPINGSNEAYELFLFLHPDCDYIKLIDGKYQYLED